jgi:hypothetical protein
MGGRVRVTALVVAALATVMVCAHAVAAAPAAAGDLAAAQSLFYSAQYEAAADAALALQQSSSADLQAIELRSTALLFQIRRAIGNAKDKDKALKECERCAAILSAFRHTTTDGITEARARLARNKADDEALYVLGKLNLNHVWLYLGTLGRRTGWSEYWEARRSMDALLERSPDHTRGRVARAWIDYIVDTQVRWGARWVLGGGNKKRGLAIVREAAANATDFYISAEARFALWDMQVREKNTEGALDTARSLAVDFPSNHELRKFIEDNQ